MKKILAMVLVIAMAMGLVLLTGCGEAKTDETEEPVSLALVVAGTFGDRSFYDSSKEGADRLGWELDTLLERTILAVRECEDAVNAQL